MDDITKTIVLCILTVLMIIANAVKMFYDIIKQNKNKSKLKENIEIYKEKSKDTYMELPINLTNKK